MLCIHVWKTWTCFTNFILLGDFNIDFCNTSHHLFCKLSNLMHVFSLTQVVKDPTHYSQSGHSSIIDLALVSNLQNVSECTVMPPLANSDHNSVFLQVKMKGSKEKAKATHRRYWRYDLADFDKARERIRDTDWNTLLENDDINVSWINWKNRFYEIMYECIPQTTSTAGSAAPWLNRKLVNGMRRRNVLFKRAKELRTSTSWLKYKIQRNKLVSNLRGAKKEYMEKLCNLSSNAKKFWSAMKKLNNSSSSIPTLLHNNSTASSDKEKASMLNQFFSNCFNRSEPPLDTSDIEQMRVHPDLCPPELLCSDEEILELLQALDTNKASGPDGIAARMLKSTASVIAPSLKTLFNYSVMNGVVPDEWKNSNIVPIPKSSNRAQASNYRPISLLSILSKILEKHFYNLIFTHVDLFCPLSPNQWGFLPGRSAGSALLTVTDEWHQILEQNAEVGTVFFDLKKAFDSVPHRPLLNKLASMGLDSHILQWLGDYLYNRQQRVIVNGEASDSLPVLSGVPQGSILGPLLFIIYVDSVFLADLSPDTRLIVYADDMLLYKPIRCTQDLVDLQSDTDKIGQWTRDNFLTLNSSKCKTMLITRKKQCSISNQFCITLYSESLNRVYLFKYLGITISYNLCWSEHISDIVARAKRVIGLIYRKFYRWCNTSTLKKLYLTLVRPILEYCCHVWDPFLHKDIELLESVQKFAFRVCTKRWREPHNHLRNLLKLPLLKDRRKKLKLTVVYKCLNGLMVMPSNIFFPVNRSSWNLRSHGSIFLYQPFAHTNSYFHSCVPSSVSLWNQLPENFHHCLSLPFFKSLIDNVV